MMRTSLSVLGKLMGVQAVRQKREAIEGSATTDAWTQHVAEQSMLKVVDPKAKPQQVARPAAAPVAAPAAGVEQRIEGNISENGTNSQGVAFETLVSAQPRDREARGLGETGLRAGVRGAMAGAIFARSRERGREMDASGRGSPGRVE